MGIRLMYKARSILAVLSAVVLFLCSCPPVTASAAAGYRAGRSDPSMITIKVSGSRDYSAAVTAVGSGILAHYDRIDLSGYGIPQTEVFDLIDLVMVKYPEIFFLNKKTPCSISLRDGNIEQLAPNYLFSKGETDSKLSEFYAEADRYLSRVTSNMSDLEKAVVLHDSLVSDVSYSKDDSCTNYTLMINKTGYCEHYSRVYAYLLARCGIRSEVIQSEEMHHEWLKVQIGGVYYNADLTWDDSGADRFGRPDRSFFLLSDDKISDSAHSHKDFSWINPSNGFYDGNIFASITSGCCTAAGEVYCIRNVGGSYKLCSARFRTGYNSADISFKTIKELDGFKWSIGGGRYWVGNYSGLESRDGILYYNSADTVYSYDPATGKTAVLCKYNEKGRSLFGIKMTGDKLCGLSGTSPSDAGKSVELYRLHDFDCQPEWEWSADMKSAEAVFTCPYCGEKKRAPAKVRENTGGGAPSCTASVKRLGKEYSVTKNAPLYSVTLSENMEKAGAEPAPYNGRYRAGTVYTLRFRDGRRPGSLTAGGEELPVTANHDGTYSVILPPADCKLEAEYREEDILDCGRLLGCGTETADGQTYAVIKTELDRTVDAKSVTGLRLTVTDGETVRNETLPLSDVEVSFSDEGRVCVFRCPLSEKDLSSRITARFSDGERLGREMRIDLKRKKNVIQ